jgi:phosphatidylserine/phosphatidylglycerophosphate/cardiolipin synthase-like enzyme
MNAEPLIEPLLEAVRRGILVTCYLCLGYNDAGELLPFQNGTNEMISNRLYDSLETDKERSLLRIYNYVAKDQTRPIHNKFKKRSCHIKLMIIDEKVAIQGMSYSFVCRDYQWQILITSRKRQPRHPILLP